MMYDNRRFVRMNQGPIAHYSLFQWEKCSNTLTDVHGGTVEYRPSCQFESNVSPI